MSGFTRDTKYYGDALVYEALESKWGRYHARHCGGAHDWLSEHAVPAGFTVVREGSGWVALTGPGLTEGVDEDALTADALWEAVTGKPGAGWIEQVRVTCRCGHCEAERKAENERIYAPRRARAAAAKVEPATDKQRDYLAKLLTRVSREQFDEAFAAAVKGTGIAPRAPRERTTTAVNRLTRAAARKLIDALAGAVALERLR